MPSVSAQSIATTTMSSKGQVVIPEPVRSRMGLRPGVRFVVVDSDDTMVLTVIKPPTLDEYEPLMAAGRRHAKEAGLKKRDLERAIGRVRREERSRMKA